ncbi:MAG: GNAT family N-acetyltransferase [Candidatus Pacearchaeota archaeon]
MKEKIEIGIVNDKESLKKIFKIREEVFQKEQKINKKLDFDGNDSGATQILISYKNEPVGCARIRFIDDKAKLERIALVKKHRGKGLGNLLLDYLIFCCKSKNVKEIYFDAQSYLENFYKKFGFVSEDEPFDEVGIKHIKMIMKIK